MRKQIVVPLAMLMMLSGAGLSISQPVTAEQSSEHQVVKTAKAETPKGDRLHRLAGQVVSVDPKAKTVTVKHLVKGQPKDVTLNVSEQAASSLVNLQPNDRVKLSYSKEHGKLVAQSIVETDNKASK